MDCAICLGALLDGRACEVVPCCGTRFHQECLLRWVGETHGGLGAPQGGCPLCRAPLPRGLAPLDGSTSNPCLTTGLHRGHSTTAGCGIFTAPCGQSGGLFGEPMQPRGRPSSMPRDVFPKSTGPPCHSSAPAGPPILFGASSGPPSLFGGAQQPSSRLFGAEDPPQSLFGGEGRRSDVLQPSLFNTWRSEAGLFGGPIQPQEQGEPTWEGQQPSTAGGLFGARECGTDVDWTRHDEMQSGGGLFGETLATAFTRAG